MQQTSSTSYFFVMPSVDSQDQNNPHWYRKMVVPEYIVDDRIWFWAMGTARIHDERIWHGEVLSSANDVAVQNMICLGLYDWTAEDRPWDGSRRSVRHAAIVSDRLWELLCLERQRVGAATCY